MSLDQIQLARQLAVVLLELFSLPWQRRRSCPG